MKKDLREQVFFHLLVGMPRIELGLYAPEAYVIPLYHIPSMRLSGQAVGDTGFEPVTFRV